jgi:hypothetical protein
MVTLRDEAVKANYDFIDQERSIGKVARSLSSSPSSNQCQNYLLEPLSGHSLEWETILPHNGGQRPDPLSLCSSSSTLANHCELRCEVHFDTGKMSDCTPIYFLKFKKESSNTEAEPCLEGPHGPMLERVPDDEPQYRRIGVFWFSDLTSRTSWFPLSARQTLVLV